MIKHTTQRKIKKKFEKSSNKGLLLLVGVFIIALILIIHKQSAVKGVRISPFLITSGTQLIDHGQQFAFVGFNMYSIASLPGKNAGCGGYTSDINGLFATLRPNSIIRFWAWQGSMAINPTTKLLDLSGIDRVLTSAKKYHQRVIISLGTQSGQCDDGLWKDSAWYQGGYKKVYNINGLTPLSYWDFIQKIVGRYKTSQVIAMWELINEPEVSDCLGYSGVACYGHQTCQDHAKAATTLRSFYDTVASKIKSIDPNHLIESGLIGTGQCGSDNNYYSYVTQSPSIDVASYHDYNENDAVMPGDRWNGLHERLRQMSAVGKPLIVGEDGMLASRSGVNCLTLDQRKDKFKAKMDKMFANGISGFIIWNRTLSEDSECNFDVGNNDPAAHLVNAYQIHQ